jgi:hypothetical protein
MTAAQRKRRVFAISVVALAATAAALSVALAYPQPFADPLLGSGWQCSRTLFLTSCTRVEQATPTAQNSHNRICPRRV